MVYITCVVIKIINNGTFKLIMKRNHILVMPLNSKVPLDPLDSCELVLGVDQISHLRGENDPQGEKQV